MQKTSKKNVFMKENGNASSNRMIKWLDDYNNMVKKVCISFVSKRKESQLETLGKANILKKS